jgi:hypothetical protein
MNRVSVQGVSDFHFSPGQIIREILGRRRACMQHTLLIDLDTKPIAIYHRNVTIHMLRKSCSNVSLYTPELGNGYDILLSEPILLGHTRHNSIKFPTRTNIINNPLSFNFSSQVQSSSFLGSSSCKYSLNCSVRSHTSLFLGFVKRFLDKW